MAEAGLNLSSNAFVFMAAITLAAVKAPASTWWFWTDFPAWYSRCLAWATLWLNCALPVNGICSLRVNIVCKPNAVQQIGFSPFRPLLHNSVCNWGMVDSNISTFSPCVENRVQQILLQARIALPRIYAKKRVIMPVTYLSV